MVTGNGQLIPQAGTILDFTSNGRSPFGAKPGRSASSAPCRVCRALWQDHRTRAAGERIRAAAPESLGRQADRRAHNSQPEGRMQPIS